MATPAAVYRPRNPQDSDYYRCVEDYFETFVQNYDEHFSRQYGFWRPYVEQVIYRYLDCGDLHNGFARVKCKDCGHTLKGTREYLLAFVLKRSGNPALAGQAPLLLPILPSEAGGGIRGAALHGCPQEGPSPAFFPRRICARLKKPLRYNLVCIKSWPTSQSTGRSFLAPVSFTLSTKGEI
jgi:hypothetical protein